MNIPSNFQAGVGLLCHSVSGVSFGQYSNALGHIISSAEFEAPLDLDSLN